MVFFIVGEGLSWSYLLLQPLQHGGQQGLSVLLVGLHLLLKLLFGILDEIVVLFEGLLDHLALVLPLLRQVLQQLRLLTLETHTTKGEASGVFTKWSP